MIAIILVAGASRRLLPYTEEMPKCLLPVGSRAILDHQLLALEWAEIRDIVLVVGYRREQVIAAVQERFPRMNVTYVVNHRFQATNTACSLWLAGDQFLDQEFLYLNGDVLFPRQLLSRLIESDRPNALAVEVKVCGDEEVKVLTDGAGRIVDLGKEVDRKSALGEFIGVARFSAEITGPFYQALGDIVKAGNNSAYFEDALRGLAAYHELHLVDVTDLPCIEIDFPEDLEQAQKLIRDEIYQQYSTPGSGL